MLSAGNSVSELDSFDTFRLETWDSEASGISDNLGTAEIFSFKSNLSNIVKNYMSPTAARHFNPQAPVAQEIADEVVFRRFQGEGVEFFYNRTSLTPPSSDF